MCPHTPNTIACAISCKATCCSPSFPWAARAVYPILWKTWILCTSITTFPLSCLKKLSSSQTQIYFSLQKPVALSFCGSCFSQLCYSNPLPLSKDVSGQALWDILFCPSESWIVSPWWLLSSLLPKVISEKFGGASHPKESVSYKGLIASIAAETTQRPL